MIGKIQKIMLVIKSNKNLPANRPAVVATIGVFDGFHKGHQYLLQTVLDEANENKLQSLMVTFDVHPRLVFAHDFLGCITDRHNKIDLLNSSNLDYLWYLNFKEVSDLSGENFINHLERFYDIKVLIVGQGFRFGKGAKQDVEDLKNFGKKYGFKVVALDRLHLNEKNISSSLLRDLVIKGDFQRVEQYLGRPYSITSKVIHGAGCGTKQLQVPTINLDVKDKVLPPCGVYITKTEIEDKEYQSITNLGYSPTMRQYGKSDELCLETHILNQEIDLYNKIAKIKFLKFLRPEQIFSDKETLKQKIQEDISQAKQYFQK